MASVVVTNSLFNDDVNVEDTELMKRRLEYLENEMTVPPDNIKNIIDKTADYVKKNGRQFEQKIYKEKKNQFSFLHVDDPYFFYYQYKLHQLFLGAQPKVLVPKVVMQLKKVDDLNKRSANEHVLKICDIVRENKKTEKSVNGENQDYIYSIADAEKKDSEKSNEQETEEKIEIMENMFTVLCPFLGSTDIEVIKTTALFVARNGNNFLQELIEREKYNSQYDFLRANNLYFNFFSQLIEAYLKCFIPEEPVTKKIKKYAQNKTDVLKYCYNLHLYNMEKKKEEEKMLEEGRQMNAVYDWTNFVIVEQVDFCIGDEEKLPLSINFANLENYIVSQLYEKDNSYEDSEKLSNLVYHMQKVESENEYELKEEKETEELRSMGKGLVDVAYEEADVKEEAKEQKQEKEEEEVEKEIKIEVEEKEKKEEEVEIEEGEGKGEGEEKVKKKEKKTEEKQYKEDQNEIEAHRTIQEKKKQVLSEEEEESESEGEEDEEEEDEEEEEEEEKIVIVRNYEKTKKHKINQENIHLCPITNKPIDINDMTKHLKTLLLDPRWKEQKEKLFEKAKKETSFAPLEDIEGNLSQFVINRPDLFGSIDEEINEHSANDKKNVKNANTKIENHNYMNGEQDVYSYIHDIYNRMSYNPPLYNEVPQENSVDTRYAKKQKK